jgi:hypothetical protein
MSCRFIPFLINCIGKLGSHCGTPPIRTIFEWGNTFKVDEIVFDITEVSLTKVIDASLPFDCRVPDYLCP